jgi:hypothetical protein
VVWVGDKADTTKGATKLPAIIKGNTPVLPLKMCQELIEEIDDRVREAKKTRSLYIQWVKGHLDNSTHVAHQYNCMVDDIAVQAKKKRITNIVLE